MADDIQVAAASRTLFGKGASRRLQIWFQQSFTVLMKSHNRCN